MPSVIIMRGNTLPPNDHTCVALLKACGKLKDLHTAHLLHAQILNKGVLITNPYVGTALVHMYARCGSLSKAHEALDNLSIQNVVSWNALISGYVHEERGRDALHCFSQMKIQGICPSPITYVCILKACASCGEALLGERLHCEILSSGLFESNGHVGNALVDMYAKCGSLSKALQIFIELPSRDVVSWNGLISRYVDMDYAEEALQCLKQMAHQGIPPNAATLVSTLKACGIVKDINKGIEIHSEIERKGILNLSQSVGNALVDMYAKCGLLEKAVDVFEELPVHDLVSWNSLVAGYARLGYEEEALSSLDDIQIQGFFADAVTTVSMLKACGNVAAIEKGKRIHLCAKEKGLLIANQLVGNALVDMYTKCGMMESANQVFKTLGCASLVAWTTIVTGYSQLGQIENALGVFDSMINKGVEPNSVTFVSVLNACSHSGSVETGQFCFEVMMRCFGIKPTPEHHTCMIDMLGRAGQLGNAMRFAMDKPSHPNVAMWLDILGACRKAGDLELGRKAYMQALFFDEKEAAAHVCMWNMYADRMRHG